VYAGPITDRAASVAVAHNHPSGSLDISPEDREITRRLKKAGDIIGIPLLDHIVFTRSGYRSFMEDGLLP
jgi:DNA repair protein RadC